MARPRRGTSGSAVLLGVLAGCGGGHPAGVPLDAAMDAQAETGMDDSGGCFPYCPVEGDDAASTPEADTDGSTSCPALRSNYESLEALAQICNPQLPDPCVSTDDPCCSVAVSSSDSDAVNAFAEAVAAYTAQCPAGCALRICQPPARTCIATGTTTGVCM